MKKLRPFLTILMLSIGTSGAIGQSIIDIGFGSSNQDDVALQFSFRQQLTPKLRLGVQLQYGMPNYRFVSAITFQDNGYSAAISVPLSLNLYESETIGLNLIVRPGLRFQGIIDPDNNNQNDSIFRSTAVEFEPGLLVGIPISDNFKLQSGVTFPMVFEVDPISLFENQTTLLHLGATYTFNNQSTVFLKSNGGSAWGASGDSQKFLWSGLIGYRFLLGKNKESFSHYIIESSL